MADDTNAQPVADEPAPEEPGASRPIDRRAFLNTTWKVLAVGLAVEAAWTSYDILNPHLSSAVGGVIDAGPATDYAAEGAKYFAAGQFWLDRKSVV